ncbi:CBS domain-containing protein [Qaidamihabitans albus]|uniref:CBS domain-containing protein n=1 Tax=Qaidamihabitans albus TaxID=2795733 RepID=UPI0018F20C53|nr:CBS domain-containing protein [Qaidamihabitans albus]
MRARDVMSTPVVTITPQTPVKAAAETLAARGFTALPVVDEDGWLLGVVTEADLVRDRFPRDARSSPAGGDARPAAGALVGDVMTAPAEAVGVRLDVVDVVRLMLDQHLRSLPVVDGDRVVGIVSRRDLVRTLARSDEALARDIRHRLAIFGGPGRWSVDVAGGEVTITDRFGSETDRHVATVLAESVPGVLRARCVRAAQ